MHHFHQGRGRLDGRHPVRQKVDRRRLVEVLARERIEVVRLLIYFLGERGEVMEIGGGRVLYGCRVYLKRR